MDKRNQGERGQEQGPKNRRGAEHAPKNGNTAKNGIGEYKNARPTRKENPKLATIDAS